MNGYLIGALFVAWFVSELEKELKKSQERKSIIIKEYTKIKSKLSLALN